MELKANVLFSRMHRQPEHVMMFLLAEMGTSGSLDGQQRLVIKGRFAPKNFEAILRRYISKLLLIHASLPPSPCSLLPLSVCLNLLTRNCDIEELNSSAI